MTSFIHELDSPQQPTPEALADAPESVREAAPSVNVVLIAAVAQNGVIGANNGIPWDYPADMAHFRDTTTGHPVIMGRRTFESIVAGLGEPLPGRTSIVLTSRGIDAELAAHDAVREVSSYEAAFEAATAACSEHGVETVYVAGGESVYSATLTLADGLVLTRIPESPTGDAYFPRCDPEDWAQTSETQRGGLTFEEFEREGGDA